MKGCYLTRQGNDRVTLAAVCPFSRGARLAYLLQQILDVHPLIEPGVTCLVAPDRVQKICETRRVDPHPADAEFGSGKRARGCREALTRSDARPALHAAYGCRRGTCIEGLQEMRVNAVEAQRAGLAVYLKPYFVFRARRNLGCFDRAKCSAGHARQQHYAIFRINLYHA